MDHDASPMLLICAVLCFIFILYIIIASFASLALTSNIKESSPNTQYPRELMIEIEEVLSKLMELRKNGNMKDYEAFLQPTMQKYCLDNLGRSYLDMAALESFHMNL